MISNMTTSSGKRSNRKGEKMRMETGIFHKMEIRSEPLQTKIISLASRDTRKGTSRVFDFEGTADAHVSRTCRFTEAVNLATATLCLCMCKSCSSCVTDGEMINLLQTCPDYGCAKAHIFKIS